jgi:hypothetical protein
MAVNAQSIICKSCAQILATVSGTGLVPRATTAEAPGCDTCKEFQPLYDAMQTADEEYASLKERRDNYRPKQDALFNVKKTHMHFNNFLIGVEGTAKEHQITLSNAYANSGDYRAAEVGGLPGTKRPRSSESTGKACASITPLRVRDIDSVPERKRLKFSDSVEFREDYRPSQHYSRSDEAYVRGRYAPPEGGEHLDTSGSVKTFLKFTGMKKVGKEWVDIWKENDEGEKKNDKGNVTNNNDTSLMNVEPADISSTAEYGVTQLDVASINPRAQRLVRRSSRTPETTPTRINVAAKPMRGQKTKNTDLPASSSNAISNPQAIDTPRATIENIAVVEGYPTNLVTNDENKEIQSPHAQIRKESRRNDVPSRQIDEMVREWHMGQRAQDTSDADGTAEQQCLGTSHCMTGEEDQQQASEKRHGSNETHGVQDVEQRRAEDGVQHKLGMAVGSWAASKRAEKTDPTTTEDAKSEHTIGDTIKLLGGSLNDNAQSAADGKAVLIQVGFLKEEEEEEEEEEDDERTTPSHRTFQPGVDGDESEARHRSAIPCPSCPTITHAPHPRKSSEAPPTDQTTDPLSHAIHAPR